MKPIVAEALLGNQDAFNGSHYHSMTFGDSVVEVLSSWIGTDGSWTIGVFTYRLLVRCSR